MPIITRRSLIAGTAMTALAAGAGAAAAAAPPTGTETPGIYRYRIGTFELTALYDGIWYRPITDKFIRNASFTEVESALADAFMPADKLATPFTTLIVNTGKRLILIDTGTGGQIAPSAGVLRANLLRRRNQSESDRPHRHLAFPSRPHQRHQGQGQRARLPQCRDHGAGGGMELLDGRRQSQRRAGGSKTHLPQPAPHIFRYREERDAFRTGSGGRARRDFRSRRRATRPDTPFSPSTPAISR